MTAPADLAAPVRPAPPSPVTPSRRPQRGFLLWVGVDPDGRDNRTAEIIELAEVLGELAREHLPTAQTYTALSLGETGRGPSRPDDLAALGDRLAHLQVVDRSTATGGPQDRRADAEPPAAVSATTAAFGETLAAAGETSAAASETSAVTGETSADDERPAPREQPTPREQPAPREHVPAPHVAGPRLTIDLPSRRVALDGVEQRLTYQEFELLAYLATSDGRVIGRSELFASVWHSRAPDPTSRTIDVHVRRLREKLGLQHELLTVRGAGYRFEHSTEVAVVESRQAG